MPYKSINDLPDKVRNVLPKSGQRLFLEVFNWAWKKFKDDTIAFMIAWGVIKKRFKKKGDKWVAKSSDFSVKSQLYYEFSLDNYYVKKSKDEYVILEGILTSTTKDYHNQQITKIALQHFAEQINNSGGIKGKIDNHKVFDLLISKGYTPNQIEYILRNIDTDLEIIKAYVDGNYLKGLIKIKRKYLPLLKRYNAISLEYRIPYNLLRNNKIYGGKILSFTLTDNPANPDTKIVM